jgi:hypothetical protein
LKSLRSTCTATAEVSAPLRPLRELRIAVDTRSASTALACPAHCCNRRSSESRARA